MESKSQQPHNAKPEKVKKTNKPNKTLKVGLIIGLVILVVLVIVGVFIYFKNYYVGPNTAFKVDGQAYSKDQVESTLNVATESYKLDRAASLNTIIDSAKYKVAAQKNNVNITDADIRLALQQTSYAGAAQDSEPLNDWVSTIGYKIAMRNYIDLQKAQAKRGFSYVFYFGNLVIPDTLHPPQLPNFGNQAMIQQERDYAKAKAEEYRELLVNKKMSPEDVLKHLKADYRLNWKYYSDSSYSTQFGNNPNVEDNWEYQVSLRPIISYIESFKKLNTPSEISTGSLPINENPQSDADYKEAYFYFVYITDDNNQAENIQKTLSDMQVVK